MAWIRFIPGFLLRAFVRLAAPSITVQKRFGVVAVTAVGMFGAGALWLVPLTSATVTVAVGSIVFTSRFAASPAGGDEARALIDENVARHQTRRKSDV